MRPGSVTPERVVNDPVPMDDDSRSPTPRDEADDDHPPPSPPATTARRGVTIDALDPHTLLAPRERAALDELTRALGMLFDAHGSVRVRLVDDAEMSRAHLSTHDDPSTTDVISLNLAHAGEPLDADLVVCVDEARRQSAARAHDPVHELALYITHGVLHTMGHDDLDEHDAQRMHAREDEILESLGIGRIYDRPVHESANGPAQGDAS